ncbi:hypothetical protein NDU88_001839 [Pleurodeles waltl]|uniref:Uncharacterized protein n=1 Tax=Pleurodeles waltl TaxID=8319 RepID=A0AAV7NGA2_PLEWA|nr:hypothetical protein NDU88_001839 [Pleurodeles waltl]
MHANPEIKGFEAAQGKEEKRANEEDANEEEADEEDTYERDLEKGAAEPRDPGKEEDTQKRKEDGGKAE